MKRTKKTLALVLVFIIAITVFTGCSGSSTTPESSSPAAGTETIKSGDKIILQIGHPNPGNDKDHAQKFCVSFKENLERLSNGQFEVQVFSDSQLGGLRDCIEGMTMGTVDMALNMNADFGAFVPEFMIFDLPFLFKNRDEAIAAVRDKELTNDMQKKLYDQFKIKLLCYGDGGFRYVLSNKNPVNKLSDFNGQKIRLAESPIFISTFKALGANPTALPTSEAFTAVQQGTVDGLELPIVSAYTMHYQEIVKYYSLTGHFFTPLTLSISVSRWETFTKEQQDLIQEAADLAAEEESKFIKEREKDALEEMKAAGITVNEVTPEFYDECFAAVQSVYTDYKDEIGQELIDKVMTKLGR